MTKANQAHQLIVGDCREEMGKMADNSIDAIVCDPPYGMSEEPDAAEVLDHWLAGDDYEHKGAGFMGKTWDSFVPGPTVWAEAARVLKPGGYCIAFSSTRTSDLLGIAMRLAGLERRDTLTWLYWSGFPKSARISDLIERSRDHDFAAIYKVTAWIAKIRDLAGFSNRDIDQFFGFNGMAGHWTSQKSQPEIPKPEQWEELKRFLCATAPVGIDQLVKRLNAEKGELGEAWKAREIQGEHKGANALQFMTEKFGDQGPALPPREIRSTPTTDTGRRFADYGTALKPAQEPALVFRKPLTGTYAENVRTWGTGALNIERSRYAANDPAWPGPNDAPIEFDPGDDLFGDKFGQTGRGDLGRWPANVYYCAKTSTAERNAGCENLQPKTGAEATDRTAGSAGLNSPRAGAGRTAARVANFHPTLKPRALLRYILRLVMPPTLETGEPPIVLDPFAGSGSLACAAADERFRSISIEISPDYAKIARARIAHATRQGVLF